MACVPLIADDFWFSLDTALPVAYDSPKMIGMTLTCRGRSRGNPFSAPFDAEDTSSSPSVSRSTATATPDTGYTIGAWEILREMVENRLIFDVRSTEAGRRERGASAPGMIYCLCPVGRGRDGALRQDAVGAGATKEAEGSRKGWEGTAREASSRQANKGFARNDPQTIERGVGSGGKPWALASQREGYGC